MLSFWRVLTSFLIALFCSADSLEFNSIYLENMRAKRESCAWKSRPRALMSSSSFQDDDFTHQDDDSTHRGDDLAHHGDDSTHHGDDIAFQGEVSKNQDKGVHLQGDDSTHQDDEFQEWEGEFVGSEACLYPLNKRLLTGKEFLGWRSRIIRSTNRMGRRWGLEGRWWEE